MCMKNVNATMFMCSSLGMEGSSVVSFNNLFDSIIPIKENDEYYIENLNIILNTSIIFDERFSDTENCLRLGEKYEFIIRLTHVDSGLGVSLSEFDLCVEKEDLKTWCKDFCEFKRIVKVRRLFMPRGLGKYALKLLIRPKTDDKDAGWNTQTIHSLLVGETR